MRTAIAVFVALTATLAIAAATFVLGMRRKNPLVLNAVRRSGRAMKPLVLRKAGRAGSPTAVVEHGGRTSQRQYQTPVVAAATSDGTTFDAASILAAIPPMYVPSGKQPDAKASRKTSGPASRTTDGNTPTSQHGKRNCSSLCVR